MRLAIHPDPMFQEGPSHYRIRLAEENWLIPNDLKQMGVAYGAHPSQSAADCGGCPDVLSARNIAALTHGGGDLWLSDLARVCPVCIRDERSEQSLAWELRFSEACVVHDVWLADRCCCGARLLASRSMLRRCTECGARLSAIPTARAPSRVVELSKLLVATASGVLVAPAIPSSETMRSPIAELDSVALYRLARVFGANGDPTVPPPRKMVGRYDRLEYSWTATSLAAEVICNWPEGLVTILDWARRFNDDSGTYQLQRTFGPLFRNIEWLLFEPKFDFVRSEIRSYLARHWRASRTRSPRLACIPYLDMHWISVREAQRELGLSRALVEEHIQRGELTADRRHTLAGRERLLIDHQSVRALKAQQQVGNLSLRDSAARLGLSRQRLRRILPLVLPDAKRCYGLGWQIPEATVQRLLDAANGATRVQQVSFDQTTVAAALKSGQLSDEALACYLTQAHATPELRPKFIVESGRGVASWIVDSLQLARLVSATSASQASIPAAHCTLMALAERWGVKQEVVYFLERAGGIQAERSAESGYRGKLVSEAEVSRFETIHVHGRKLAEQLRCSPKYLTQNLIRRGIEPAYGPSDGCRQVFYRRCAELDLAVEQLRRLRPGKSRAARVTADLLNQTPAPSAAPAIAKIKLVEVAGRASRTTPIGELARAVQRHDSRRNPQPSRQAVVSALVPAGQVRRIDG